LKQYRAGDRELPSRRQFVDDFTQWLERYHNKPHRGLDKKTPAEVYASREQCKLEDCSEAIFWPRTTRVARRSCIHLDNREYGASELIHYNSTEVVIEYNLHDDSSVRVLDSKGRFICDAHLISKAAYIPSSRIVEAKQKREIEQTKRLDNKIREIEKRANLAITHVDQINNPVIAASVSTPVTDRSDDINRTSSTIINPEDLYYESHEN